LFRYNLYLDGLEQCDSLGSEQLFKVVKHVNETANATAAAEFEKIGLKPFQSQFMTLKVDVMKEVIDMVEKECLIIPSLSTSCWEEMISLPFYFHCSDFKVHLSQRRS